MIVSGVPFLRPFFMPGYLIRMLRVECCANDNGSVWGYAG